MRENFLGCPIDILTMDETVELARSAMRCHLRLQHVALNVAKFVNMRRDPVLAADVAKSDVVSIDGMGIVWGARCVGIPARVRVTGIDLLTELLAVCADEGFKPYFLGATPEISERAVGRVREKYPSIQFAGARDGYFSPDRERQVVDGIRSSGADCLFIGMPTPRKERFLASYRDELNVSFVMGVGGAFDVLAGQIRRAPVRMQQLGLEWLYRIYQEPERMWWRYAQTNTLFAGILLQAIVQQRLKAPPTALGVATPNSTRGEG
jgi:N-acetylglucosaminyldiphosphoundecaprenol N-acetyl-beta-D-mannosaminyltransferase